MKYPVALHAIALTLMLFSLSAQAEELVAGDRINAANLEEALGKTFAGHKVSDLITEAMRFHIREWNLEVTLKDHEEVPLTQLELDNTAKYSDDVQFDPETLEVTGYTAGWPFPEIDPDDRWAGHKVMWNYYLQNTYGSSFDGDYHFLFTDASNGLERVQEWYNVQIKMIGRPYPPHVLEGGDLVAKALLFARQPFDVRGIGQFILRHNSPQVESNWAYLRSVRRVRRLSGGSWMDSLAGGVQLNDEYDGFAGRPSWYPDSRYLGTRWILAVPNLTLPLVKDGTYPTVDTEQPPYNNPVVEWEPRKVHVVEFTMPDEHPYSRRIYYVETEFPRIYMTEHYDRNNELAKISYVFSTPTEGDDGFIGMLPWQGTTFDINRREGWTYVNANGTLHDTELTPDDVTLQQLRRGPD